MAVQLVRQRHGNDCGAAALATVLHAHGDAAVGDVLAATLQNRRGSTLAELARVARTYGLEALGWTVSYEQISSLQLPAVAHLGIVARGHFVVILEWSPSGVVVGDPARGRRILNRKRFCRRWSGHILTMTRPGRAGSAASIG